MITPRIAAAWRSRLALTSLLVAVVACSPAAQQTPGVGQPSPGDTSTPTPASAPATPTDSPVTPTDPTPAPSPGTTPPAAPPQTDPPQTEPPPALPDDAWRTAELTDVRTGQTLVVNELYGRLVVVQPMAIWCTTCRSQQNEARRALEQLGGDDIVYISLDVDPNETEPDLARYADQREWPWHFVVASRDVSRSLAQVFGDQVLSPPSAPKIFISPDGQAQVSFGLKPAAELQAELAALLP